MPIVFVILAAVIGCNATWWRWADNRLKQTHSLSPLWRRAGRIAIGVFIISQMVYLCTILSPRSGHRVQKWVPIPLVATTYLWSLLVLPVSLIATGLITLTRKIKGSHPTPVLRYAEEPGLHGEEPGSSAPLKTGVEMSRRDLFSTAAVAIPPLITTGLVIRSLPQLTTFRIRSIHLQIPNLPRPLDGIRIAHVSDLHVGRYTRPAQIPRMVDAVNKLAADLVLFTGDLIDVSIEDLPRGIDAMKQIDPRSGMALIEGNHDLIDDPNEFDRRVKQAGLPLLVDEEKMVTVRGVPVQLLGTRWGAAYGNRRQAGPVAFEQSIRKLNDLRDRSAFPILLAHHPHTFDTAAVYDYPLTLSGHTHGGQIMLSDQVGFGPLFYRYWSGIYRKNHSQLVVNNGVGNWFPLRVNAPAEIIELTLHSASA